MNKETADIVARAFYAAVKVVVKALEQDPAVHTDIRDFFISQSDIHPEDMIRVMQLLNGTLVFPLVLSKPL